jgi:hypothetical protein
MNKLSLLKKFEYSLPASTVTVFDKQQTNGVAKHASLFKLRIDFVAGVLNFEGYRKYITITNFHEKSYLVNSISERLKIEMMISPATAINLNEPETDGMIFPMEGLIENANCLIPCAGFLMLDRVGIGRKYPEDLWNISCYIYDIQFTDFEINFKLPI